jgi:PAS domain S-box-containing protein
MFPPRAGKFMKLPHRLLIIVSLALVPLSALQIYSAFRLEDQQTLATFAEAQRILQLIEDEQAGTITGIRQLLTTIRQVPVVINQRWAQCEDMMIRLKKEYPPNLDLYVTNNDGIVKCSTNPLALGIDVSMRRHVKEALAGVEFYIGGQITPRTKNGTALPFAVPYRSSEGGGVSGVVIALLDIRWVDDYLADKPLPPSSALTLADRDGQIVAQVPRTDDTSGKRLPEEFMALLNRNSRGIAHLTNGGPERLVAYSPVNSGQQGLFTALAIDNSIALHQIKKDRNLALLTLFTLAAGTAIAIIWLGDRYVSGPVMKLADVTTRLRAGDLTARADVSSNAGEFAALAEDFNAMASALDTRERALQASESQHRAVFETAVDAMVVIDDVGTIQTVNPAAAATFGYSKAELIGRNVSILTGDEHQERHDGYIGNYLRTGLRRIIGIGREVQGCRKDGSVFPLELSIAEWRGRDGQRFFTGIMRNITARRAAEREVEEERNRLRHIIEGAPFPVMVHAEDGQVLHISRTWLDITGYGREQLATIADWVERAYGPVNDGPGSPVKTDIERLFQLDKPIDEGEYVIRTAERKKRIWAFRSAPVGEDRNGRRLVVSMAADITERRDGEERIKLLMREVDHRAKNALMVVQSIVHLSRSEDPEKFSEAVDGRIQAMARAHSLLADAKWSGADLQRLLSDELAAYADERVDLTGPPISLRPEATQAVSLALHELATNALKHGALSVEYGRLSIGWSFVTPGGSLTVEWREDGGPLIRSQPSRQGFGTVLLRQVVESQLGGTIDLLWLEDGLFCQLSLPGDTWQTSGVAESVVRDIVKPPEALTAMALQQLLEDAGYIVLGPVGRVEDALDLLRSGPPDAAVLDVNLFGATVDPVAAMLKDMGVPFLFCTGYHSGATAGALHPNAPVLGKPVNANNLLNAVSGLISQPATM